MQRYCMLRLKKKLEQRRRKLDYNHGSKIKMAMSCVSRQDQKTSEEVLKRTNFKRNLKNNNKRRKEKKVIF